MFPPEPACERWRMALDQIIAYFLEAVRLAERVREAASESGTEGLVAVVAEQARLARHMESFSRELESAVPSILRQCAETESGDVRDLLRGLDETYGLDLEWRCEKIAALAQELALLQTANHRLLRSLAEESERLRSHLLSAWGDWVIYGDKGFAAEDDRGPRRVSYSA